MRPCVDECRQRACTQSDDSQLNEAIDDFRQVVGASVGLHLREHAVKCLELSLGCLNRLLHFQCVHGRQPPAQPNSNHHARVSHLPNSASVLCTARDRIKERRTMSAPPDSFVDPRVPSPGRSAMGRVQLLHGVRVPTTHTSYTDATCIVGKTLRRIVPWSLFCTLSSIPAGTSVCTGFRRMSCNDHTCGVASVVTTQLQQPPPRPTWRCAPQPGRRGCVDSSRAAPSLSALSRKHTGTGLAPCGAALQRQPLEHTSCSASTSTRSSAVRFSDCSSASATCRLA